MNLTQRAVIMQRWHVARWHVVRHEWIPGLRDDFDGLTPKLEKLIHTLEWVRIEEFAQSSWRGIERPPHERAWLANAYVAKAVLGIGTTAGLLERLSIDRALRRICGFPPYRLPRCCPRPRCTTVGPPFPCHSSAHGV
jgi:hypothetical protein